MLRFAFDFDRIFNVALHTNFVNSHPVDYVSTNCNALLYAATAFIIQFDLYDTSIKSAYRQWYTISGLAALHRQSRLHKTNNSERLESIVYTLWR
jgi:hypothetical protein